MIDRHAVRAVVEGGSTSAEAARQFGVSQRTVQRILREGEIESADDGEARRARGVGRPRVPSGVGERLVALGSARAPPRADGAAGGVPGRRESERVGRS